MSGRDLESAGAGYWPSPWPVECGGNRRQKHSKGSLDAGAGTASVVSVRNGQWNVMVVRRDEGEWYVGGTMAAFQGDPPFGWVQRIDPLTLEVLDDSGPLPCGDHVWCGSTAVHRNGSIYNINGSYLHRLSPSLEIQTERKLPADCAHNGMLFLSDGTIVTKDLQLDTGVGSTFTRLDPDTLELVHDPVRLPEPSMGRIAAEVGPDGEVIYVPGSTKFYRLLVEPDGLRADDEWQPVYRSDQSQGMAWDSCLSAGYAWAMDNGDLSGIRTIFAVHPNGRIGSRSPGELSWQNPAPWPGHQRLLRIDLVNGDIAAASPFDTGGGGIIAPPVHVPSTGTIVCWDSINGGLAGLDDSTLETKWLTGIRATMQPVVYEDSGEVVINDFIGGRDELVVIDSATGAESDRVDTGSRLANGMFLTPGENRDVYYCSTLTLTRVSWS